MKLYLSSYRIPAPDELAGLLGKPLSAASVALIPNAKDYYGARARAYKVGDFAQYMERLGLDVDVVDLREYDNPETLKKHLAAHNLVWAMGGNTYVLRCEMARSGFDKIIRGVLAGGTVYGGDSAGAMVAGSSIAGAEAADEPAFAEKVIEDGLRLMPAVILPHADNPELAPVLPVFRRTHRGRKVVELNDSQVFIADGSKHWIAGAPAPPAPAPHKESQAQLGARLQAAGREVSVGCRYRHYKKREYTVVALALREEDGEPLVVYQADYGARVTWVRPLASWQEEVAAGGRMVPRFVKLA